MTLSSPPTDARIFLVEDDEELAALVKEYLCKQGYHVEVESHGTEAAKRIPASGADLVILDLMLPGMNGTEVCRHIRPLFDGPILMLTALDDDMDQLVGLELGADDYIVKPVAPRLLLARIHAHLRRVPSREQADLGMLQTAGELQVGDLTIDRKRLEVSLGNTPVSLTNAEFELLLLLAEAEGEIVSRDDILNSLRGFEYDGLDRSIDRRISRLRKKLSDDPQNPQRIKTVRGKGYVLCAYQA